MNLRKDWTKQPFIEATYRGVWPQMTITAPIYRDDGVKSYRTNEYPQQRPVIGQRNLVK